MVFVVLFGGFLVVFLILFSFALFYCFGFLFGFFLGGGGLLVLRNEGKLPVLGMNYYFTFIIIF